MQNTTKIYENIVPEIRNGTVDSNHSGTRIQLISRYIFYEAYKGLKMIGNARQGGRSTGILINCSESIATK